MIARSLQGIGCLRELRPLAMGLGPQEPTSVTAARLSRSSLRRQCYWHLLDLHAWTAGKSCCWLYATAAAPTCCSTWAGSGGNTLGPHARRCHPGTCAAQRQVGILHAWMGYGTSVVVTSERGRPFDLNTIRLNRTNAGRHVWTMDVADGAWAVGRTGS